MTGLSIGGNPIGGVVETTDPITLQIAAGLGTFTYSGVAASLTSTRLVVAALGTFALTGRAVVARYSYGNATGSYVLTGVRVSDIYRLLTAAGSYSLVGRITSGFLGVATVITRLVERRPPVLVRRRTSDPTLED